MDNPTPNWIEAGSRPGSYRPLHLEEVRDSLARLDAELAPEDYELDLEQMNVCFERGVMRASVPTSNCSGQLLISELAAANLARTVLPPRFLSGLQQLSLLGPAGEHLATRSWAEFAGRRPQSRLVRTARIPGSDRREVRSCHSTSYAPYSNLEFVEDLLAAGGLFAEMDVLDMRVSDRAMRLRLVESHREIDLRAPVPMIEAWNSETGLRRTSLHGGTWRLVCTNGLGTWEEGNGHQWTHRGDPSRIHREIGPAAQAIAQTVQQLVDAWYQGQEIRIEHPLAWLESQLENRLTPSLRRAILDHYRDRPLADISLTTCIESITELAQQQSCFLDQQEIEREASRLLRTGLATLAQAA